MLKYCNMATNINEINNKSLIFVAKKPKSNIFF